MLTIKMRNLLSIAASIFFGILLLLNATHASAQQGNTYGVMPFSVNGPAGYKYLEKAIPEMLSSRLYWKDHFNPIAQEQTAKLGAVSGESNAANAQKTLKTAYLIYGTVNIIGEDASLDVKIRDSKGNIVSKNRETKVAQLIPVLKTVADSISTDIFKRPSQTNTVRETTTPAKVNQMNSEIVVNQDSSKDVYLNPQFRYTGSDTDSSRQRSQTLNFSSVDMTIGDLDNDNKNEVLILSATRLYIFNYEKEQLKQMAEYKFPVNCQLLRVSVLPSSAGTPKIIVSTLDQKKPRSFIFTYKGGALAEVNNRVPYFLNVMNLPPDYAPYLVGQSYVTPGLFRMGVYEAIINGTEVSLNKKLDLPEGANLFNTTFMPGSNGVPAESKVVMLSSRERLVVFNNSGGRLSETDERFSGSANGVEVSTSMPGLGDDQVTIPNTFFMPLRMYAVDLDADGRYELLANRPISTASELFERYRFFPQSEIQALYWDGTGLNLQWKTRRIKGSTVAFQIADVNNDGSTSLVVCINTHPGALGAAKRKTILLVYPLDLTKTDPNTAADPSEKEEQ
ncbi:hypothetical protein [Desulfovibrio litoralis]|uniref:VCBS repeat-containing protein n=1 Tax=Desulfovibrio litoralis DSM 11393 TaxID=1121455 RepID=A0A1M7TQG9_9BACT|nr:hypothetical protein [Desulfovibrio litoralis]SHN72950.1 hypothetical protein SAMN02745728_02363 [Desulfovibrio litoralis DSM 11393]